MLAAGDLGFLSPFLVVPLLFLAIGFVIRRKWRLVKVRKEEIRRLLVLASEEAARAELEASAGYGAVSMAKNYQCAVCYCPTTTRCAQCKAVRYCSGKCQIIHWRQGHKEECYPPITNHRITDVASDSSQETAEQEEYATYGDIYKTEDRMHAIANPIETFHEEPVLSTSCRSSEGSCVKDDDIKVELLADRKRTNSASVSSGTSFSGFTASTSSELSDDVSITESISSNDSERLDGYLSADGDLDILETTSGVKNGDHSKPVSPKFAISVDSVDNFNGLSKLNQTKPNHSDMEIQHKSTSADVENHCTSTSSPCLRIDGIREGSIGKPCTVSDGFSGTTLDGYGSSNDAHDDSALSNSNRAGNHYSSDSKSSLRFSFNLSGSSTPPIHAPESKAEGSRSDDSLPATLGISKPIDGSNLSETLSVDAVKLKNLSLERSNCTDKDSSSNPHLSKSGEFKSLSATSSLAYGSTCTGGDSLNTGSSNISSLPSSKSERSNHVINGVGISSHPLRSGEPGCLSSGASDVYLSSTAGGYSVPRVKTGKVDVFNSCAANSSYVAGCPPNARNGLKTSVLKVVDQFRGSKLSKHYPVGVGSEVAARYSDKGLFPYDLFVKLYNWNKVVLHPCGLKNCGNSCYANAVLQCLAFTPPLTAYFMQGLHSKACVKKEWCFMCEFESLILKAKEGKSPLSPIGILTQLQNISNQLGNGREEDAHEFLRYAIDTMQSVCLKELGVKASGSLEEDTTLIGLTFGGYLRSKIKCTKCQGKSERQERMMDLTVEIGGDIETLEEALRQFTGTEILDGENKYQCGRCKSYEKAKKKLTLLEVPNILTIALKRFQSGKFGKLNKPIRFPEILDLAPYMSGTSDKSPIYRLYGVVVHLDIMNAAFSGHYVCYVKNIQNKWFKIDDSTVTNVEPERALTKGAYMLLYARCSPRAPRWIRNRVLSPDPKTKSIPSRNNGNHTVSKSSAAPTHSNSGEFYPSSAYSDGLSSVESFYSRFHQIQRILEGDSSSDNSSLISSNSDEGSCSTESTRDSTSTDDLSDYIFGDSGHGWNSPWRNSSDSDASSSSSSPLYPRHSPLTELERHASGYPKTSGSQTDHTGSTIEESRGSRRLVDLEGKGSVPFLHSDTTRHRRKLSSSGSSRESESERLEWVNNNSLNDVKTGVSVRKSTRERRD